MQAKSEKFYLSGPFGTSESLKNFPGAPSAQVTVKLSKFPFEWQLNAGVSRVKCSGSLVFSLLESQGRSVWNVANKKLQDIVAAKIQKI